MYMRLLCYESTSDITTQEQLWLAVRNNGWMSCGPIQGVNRFYIPESRVFWALLVDPTLRRLPNDDYIA